MTFPIDAVRAQFPALASTDSGLPRIYFDGPGGTQVCKPAIDRMVAHMTRGTANSGGGFASSVETDAESAAAHEAMADLLGGEPGEIAFGQNMTSLTLSISRALARNWAADDEIILSRLDHDANVSPWLLVAADRGMVVKWIDIDPRVGTLRLDTLADLLGPRTKLVAIGGASNALGTINDVAEAVRIVRAHSNALVFVDGVQSVPHLPTDVRALDCDFLACSSYKFFGPHQGILWGKAEVLREIEAYKVRPAAIDPPAARFETGTPSFESHAGVLGTVDYLDWLGGQVSSANTRRGRLVAAMEACIAYEIGLGERLLLGLATLPGLTLYGPPTMAGRVPTFSFNIEGHTPEAVERHLAVCGIFVWAGSFYAIEPVERLGLTGTGMVRVGLCHYSTAAEVDALIDGLRTL